MNNESIARLTTLRPPPDMIAPPSSVAYEFFPRRRRCSSSGDFGFWLFPELEQERGAAKARITALLVWSWELGLDGMSSECNGRPMPSLPFSGRARVGDRGAIYRRNVCFVLITDPRL